MSYRLSAHAQREVMIRFINLERKFILIFLIFTSVNSKPNQEINKPLELPVVAWRPKIRPLNAQNYYMSVVEKKDRFYK